MVYCKYTYCFGNITYRKGCHVTAGKRTTIYVDQETKRRLSKLATVECRKIVDMLRVLLNFYIAHQEHLAQND